MTVRPAKAVDIPAIVSFLVECHARSHYGSSGVNVDVVHTKKLLLMAIHRHDHKTENACWAEVVEHAGQICGLMVATMARVYMIGDKLMATDVLFATNALAQPSDAGRLLLGMVQWAKRSPYCTEIKCGVTSIIGDPERAGKLLQRLGMERYGSIFRMELERKAA
ncbi:MAG: hypothetical protein E5V63_04090 [Mesorhizobium sp.]|nr:MAG: hypothetical protein E5V63_04090 [Mesorhizobium sp.]